MFRPTPGELLAGITESLRATVLPELNGGAAHRQLKAALHTLSRLRHAWDRLPSYLAEDNADIRATMSDVIRGLRAASKSSPDTLAAIDGRLESIHAVRPEALLQDDFNDESLARTAAVSETLQALLIELENFLRLPANIELVGVDQASAQLEQLYRRMTQRELTAWAIRADDSRQLTHASEHAS
jgi:hypothetical protein